MATYRRKRQNSLGPDDEAIVQKKSRVGDAYRDEMAEDTHMPSFILREGASDNFSGSILSEDFTNQASTFCTSPNDPNVTIFPHQTRRRIRVPKAGDTRGTVFDMKQIEEEEEREFGEHRAPNNEPSNTRLSSILRRSPRIRVPKVGDTRGSVFDMEELEKEDEREFGPYREPAARSSSNAPASGQSSGQFQQASAGTFQRARDPSPNLNPRVVEVDDSDEETEASSFESLHFPSSPRARSASGDEPLAGSDTKTPSSVIATDGAVSDRRKRSKDELQRAVSLEEDGIASHETISSTKAADETKFLGQLVERLDITHVVASSPQVIEFAGENILLSIRNSGGPVRIKIENGQEKAEPPQTHEALACTSSRKSSSSNTGERATEAESVHEHPAGATDSELSSQSGAPHQSPAFDVGPDFSLSGQQVSAPKQVAGEQRTWANYGQGYRNSSTYTDQRPRSFRYHRKKGGYLGGSRGSHRGSYGSAREATHVGFGGSYGGGNGGDYKVTYGDGYHTEGHYGGGHQGSYLRGFGRWSQ
ncbi:hypothetical protein K4K57_007933 [Colletotrichum sp. SAR 10_99]|nr:hypothetical protein K4K55_007513 [Colletotrichum sp. SAR 10_96]KAI8253532.1 hypothetical protein K4K56_008641 [Colletotrichum sp. SAR 10_98]KAJ5010003.1 hypothetical protein K4K57_007933 [Colletotrichum sp. SAR 10_99]